MTTAYWGLGGTEDLGGGLKARFALESFFRYVALAYDRPYLSGDVRR